VSAASASPGTHDDVGVEPHGPLRALAPGLHVVEGPWGFMGRRMTVLDTGDGLAVHSAMRLHQADMAGLDALGPVRWILVPNPEHSSEASWYAARYPDARLLVPRECRGRLERAGVGPIHGTLDDDWPGWFAGKLERVALRGTRLNPEVVFLHVATRTLVVCDMAFNMPSAPMSAGVRLFMRLNDGLDRFGPTRVFRWFVIADRRKLAASLRPVWDWEFERVIVGHGDVVETGGKARLRDACAFLER
jgi:hypothetical protein